MCVGTCLDQLHDGVEKIEINFEYSLLNDILMIPSLMGLSWIDKLQGLFHGSWDTPLRNSSIITFGWKY